MLVNLQAEMVRFGVTPAAIAKVINKDERAVKNRLKGTVDITGDELRAIRDHFFPNFTLDYLLSEKPIVAPDGLIDRAS